RASSWRVRGRDVFARPHPGRVEENLPAPLRLPELDRDEVGLRLGRLGRDRVGGAVRLTVVVTPLQGDVDVNALRPRGLRRPLEPVATQDLPDDERGPD